MKVGMQTPGGEASSNKVVKYSKVQTEIGSTSTVDDKSLYLCPIDCKCDILYDRSKAGYCTYKHIDPVRSSQTANCLQNVK